MSNVYKRLEKLLNENHISGAKMCQDIGMSKSFMTELRKGRAKSIKLETAQKIASYFNVPVGYLMGEEENEKPTVQDDGLSKEKQELFDFIKTLPQEKVELLLQVAKSIK